MVSASCAALRSRLSNVTPASSHHQIRWVAYDHCISRLIAKDVRFAAGEAMSADRDRVISITLSESEWRAFVARQPQPVNWLRERIRDEVNTQPKDDDKNAA
jgi:hypothetical protein